MDVARQVTPGTEREHDQRDYRQRQQQQIAAHIENRQYRQSDQQQRQQLVAVQKQAHACYPFRVQLTVPACDQAPERAQQQPQAEPDQQRDQQGETAAEKKFASDIDHGRENIDVLGFEVVQIVACENKRTFDVPAAFAPVRGDFSQTRGDLRWKFLLVEAGKRCERLVRDFVLLLVEFDFAAQFLDTAGFLGRFLEAVQQRARDLHQFVVPAQLRLRFVVLAAQAGTAHRYVFERSGQAGYGYTQIRDPGIDLLLVHFIGIGELLQQVTDTRALVLERLLDGEQPAHGLLLL